MLNEIISEIEDRQLALSKLRERHSLELEYEVYLLSKLREKLEKEVNQMLENQAQTEKQRISFKEAV